MLSAADHQHMEENGYVVIPDAVPPEDLAAVVDGIWSHMRMDRNNSDSWCEDPHGDKLQMYGFMRQMHTPALPVAQTREYPFSLAQVSAGYHPSTTPRGLCHRRRDSGQSRASADGTETTVGQPVRRHQFG